MPKRLGFFFITVAVAALVSADDVWLDVNGQPLPFETDAELLEFLRTAKVVESKPIGVGLNQSRKLTLDENGVRAHAAFRHADIRETSAAIQGVIYKFFADSYLFECAAYELSKLIELPRVPPATVRRVRHNRGSVQIWVENPLDEKSESFHPPDPMGWVRQVWDMHFFDNLIYNIDRNPGNILVSRDYRLWLIDHTRAFQFKHTLLDDKVMRVPRRSYERLLALTKEDFRKALRDYLTPRELKSLLERRKAMKAYVEKLVTERGEDAVFY